MSLFDETDASDYHHPIYFLVVGTWYSVCVLKIEDRRYKIQDNSGTIILHFSFIIGTYTTRYLYFHKYFKTQCQTKSAKHLSSSLLLQVD